MVVSLSQSCNSLCYHPLQTEDELELVNEVISPTSVTRMSRWISTVRTLLAWLQYCPRVSHRFAPLTFLGVAFSSHLTACGSWLCCWDHDLRSENLEQQTSTVICASAELSLSDPVSFEPDPFTPSCDTT